MTVVQNVTVGVNPVLPVFDGSNIWVPNFNGDASVSVVRARDGLVLATLTGNGLNDPLQAAFDGQRVLVTNMVGNSVSMWNAADLTPLGSFPTGAATQPFGACSDGINFWVTLTVQTNLPGFRPDASEPGKSKCAALESAARLAAVTVLRAGRESLSALLLRKP